MHKVAVIGAGWAGCAAAVELARNGVCVSLFEASRTLGGRARRLDLGGKRLDNGQHILLGAYTESLRLMQLVGVDPDQALLRLPLQMRYPAGCGGMDFLTPRLPAPLHMLIGLWRTTGLQREDKLALMRFSSTARWMGWTLNTDCSVAELLERFDQTERLVALMWRPLCIAALNTPPERASAQVFLNVLRDSLGARRRASDMLIPRVDLTALFPEQAARYIEEHGGSVHLGSMITQLSRHGEHWRLEIRNNANLDEMFDSVVLATSAEQAQGLAGALVAPAIRNCITYEPISTCYLQYEPTLRLEQAFFALVDGPERGDWGQFVFDRGCLDPAHTGLLAVVVSAAGDASALGQAELAKSIAQQLARTFKRPQLADPAWTRVITEKRATFSCSPSLERPPVATTAKGLVLAGDYTASAYPATLEAAARSGVQAARALRAALSGT